MARTIYIVEIEIETRAPDVDAEMPDISALDALIDDAKGYPFRRALEKIIAKSDWPDVEVGDVKVIGTRNG